MSYRVGTLPALPRHPPRGLERVMNPSPLMPVWPALAPVDRTGFDIGWDHAHHGLVPAAELLHPGAPVRQGWMAGKAVFGHRTLPGGRHLRQCLLLRLLAWRRGIGFDDQQVTPHFLGQLAALRCPVLRCTLGGTAGQAQAAVVERLNPQGAYAAGNLATVSAQAAVALEGLSVQQAVCHARAAQVGDSPVRGYGAAVWWRLAALRAFATPLPFAQAALLPLAVTPPNRVRLLNAAQGLQALVTRLFMAPGWSLRCRGVGLLLPTPPLRHDFNRFVGAMAPRVLEAPADATGLRGALEDAWLDARVQRRWQHLVLGLGEAATEDLLERVVQAGLATVRIVNHPPQRATEGWGLPSATAQRVSRYSARTQPQGPAAPAPHAARGLGLAAAWAIRAPKAAAPATPAARV